MSGPEHLYEQTLVLRTQAGDDRAFEELLTLYGPRLQEFLRKMLTNSAQIDDVAQEIWIAIYRGLPRLSDVTRFKPWAFRIARDRVYREYRKRRISFQTSGDLADVPEADSTNGDIDREELRACIEQLSIDHREVLVLRYLNDLSYEDIARVTGSHLGTVRSRIHYAKCALRKLIKERKP